MAHGDGSWLDAEGCPPGKFRNELPGGGPVSAMLAGAAMMTRLVRRGEDQGGGPAVGRAWQPRPSGMRSTVWWARSLRRSKLIWPPVHVFGSLPRWGEEVPQIAGGEAGGPDRQCTAGDEKRLEARVSEAHAGGVSEESLVVQRPRP
jgi:hypothetical protein